MRITSTWAVVVTVIILISLKVYNPIPLQTLQLKTYDYYQTFGARYDSKSLVLLDISDLAIESKGQWPWKRDQVGRIVVNAYKNGAALVILQLAFPQKDRLGGDEMFLKMISKYPVILTETKDVKNLTSISRKALAIGDVEVPIDIDGTIRKLPLDNSMPSVIMKVIKFPIPKQDDIWVDFRHNIPRIDYTDKDWSAMKGKIVFIGVTFKGTTFVQTPNGLKNTHEIMALGTETLLSGKFISMPSWSHILEWSLIIGSSIIFLLLIPRLGVLWSLVPWLLYTISVPMSSFYLFNKFLYLTNWTYPVIVGFIVFAHLIFNNFARENRLKQQIRKQFETYLDPRQVAILQKDPSKLKLGGERKEMSFLFMDIVGFTPISEYYKNKDDPEGLVEVVNDYLNRMTKIVLDNGGTVDKYMGDCIMAFWNAPLDCEDHAEMAVKTAIECAEETSRLKSEFKAKGLPDINIGSGVNTGTCIVGNMGSDTRFDYSVIGDAVNLAARLEATTRNYKNDEGGIVSTLYSSYTMEKLKNIKSIEVDKIKVKGKEELITIYKPI
jgi:adenylate cyclase